MIDIKTYTVSDLSTNCYLLTDEDTKEMAVVDPGGKSTSLIDSINDNGGKLKYVLLTHGHYDHIGFAKEIADMFNAKIVCHKNTDKFLSDSNLNLSVNHSEFVISPFRADILLKDGDELYLGKSKIEFLSTPGHTEGCCCFIFDNNMISGDTLFCESFGRTDLPTGSLSKMSQSLRKIHSLNNNYNIFPGHGRFTTLDHEKKYNPFMRRF